MMVFEDRKMRCDYRNYWNRSRLSIILNSNFPRLVIEVNLYYRSTCILNVPLSKNAWRSIYLENASTQPTLLQNNVLNYRIDII